MTSQVSADKPVSQSENADESHSGETHEQHVGRLFREHNESLVRYLRVRLHSQEEAKEVAQQAYVQLLGLDHPETVHFLQGYLFRTAANLAKNRIKQRIQRRRNDEIVFFDTSFEDSRSPERAWAGDREIAIVYRALNELPPNCRESFRLVRLEELSVDDAARRLKITPRHIRRNIARALAHLMAAVESAATQGGSR
ncbi:MAG TPA: sigma-70 family RNA polymerase sigma factor [Steroidobacter sp.]|uniref:RNA polymerase sigma factor n=1 Tax=Steroidobacter sp. TaxID=1978227 RepID=UPI002EDB1164